MDQGQRYKKGERLFEEGATIDKVFVIQSGRVQLNINRSGRPIELEQVGASQLLGEQAVAGNGKATYNAEASSEVKVIEIPAALLKDQVSKAPATLKLLVKCLVEEIKKLRATLKGKVMEMDTAQCPQSMIPRVFNLIQLVVRRSGTHYMKKEEGDQVFQMSKKDKEYEWKQSGMVMSWAALKVVTARMFLESPSRVLGAIEILSKLGYAELRYEEVEEGEGPELFEVCIFDLDIAEQFAEFYQYHYFKGGKAEVIYVDSMAVKVGTALLGAAEGVEPDRRGSVELEYQSMLTNIKSNFGFDLNSNHLSTLEKKGLFVKRSTRDEGVFLSFDKQEFESTINHWKIISEIDKWNERGFVDLKENIDLRVDGDASGTCPQCQTKVNEEQKFCMECGCKLEPAA